MADRLWNFNRVIVIPRKLLKWVFLLILYFISLALSQFDILTLSPVLNESLRVVMENVSFIACPCYLPNQKYTFKQFKSGTSAQKRRRLQLLQDFNFWVCRKCRKSLLHSESTTILRRYQHPKDVTLTCSELKI
jgi:hypothetical protein